MRSRLSILAVAVFAISSCLPLKPEIPMTERPASPWRELLERQRASFLSLKSLARIRVERNGRKRSYESASVILSGQERFRIEAYGPLGEPLLILAWAGGEALLWLRGEPGPALASEAGLERLTGMRVRPHDLAALLAGNLPNAATGGEDRLFCSEAGDCVLELRKEGDLWRARVSLASSEAAPVLQGYERRRDGKLAFHAAFEERERTAGYLLPRRIILEHPERKVKVTVEYEDAELNTPVDEGVFVLPGEGGAP